MTQTLAARRKLLGPEHVDTADTLSAFSALRLKQQNYVQAESLAREALAIFRRRSVNQFRMYRAEALLGESLAGQQKFVEGELHLLSAYSGMRSAAIRTRDRTRMKEAGEHIVRLYESWSKSDQAEQWRSRLARN